MTNLIVTWQDINRLEVSPIYQIHGAFDDYPFPYDAVARVIIQVPDGMSHVAVMPDGMTGTITGNGKAVARWEWCADGYVIYPPDSDGRKGEQMEYDVRRASYIIHSAITALRMVSAFNLPRVEAQKRDVKRATKGLKPETKTDKYYILKLSGRSLDYLPEPQGKCRGESGIKQRWHMCRGHYRHLKSGKVVFVKGHYRGDKALGIVHKDYAL